MYFCILVPKTAAALLPLLNIVPPPLNPPPPLPSATLYPSIPSSPPRAACMIFTGDQWIARDARAGKANCSLYPQAVMRKILKLEGLDWHGAVRDQCQIFGPSPGVSLARSGLATVRRESPNCRALLGRDDEVPLRDRRINHLLRNWWQLCWEEGIHNRGGDAMSKRCGDVRHWRPSREAQA